MTGQTIPTVKRVRGWWKKHESKLVGMGFSGCVIDNVKYDTDEIRLCWCCGDAGYQERCHIVPRSAGGDDREQNLFLMCGTCHHQSPDYFDSSAFVVWVNDNANKNQDRMMALISDMMLLVSQQGIYCNLDTFRSEMERAMMVELPSHTSQVSFETKIYHIKKCVNDAINLSRSKIL